MTADGGASHPSSSSIAVPSPARTDRSDASRLHQHDRRGQQGDAGHHPRRQQQPCAGAVDDQHRQQGGDEHQGRRPDQRQQIRPPVGLLTLQQQSPAADLAVLVIQPDPRQREREHQPGRQHRLQRPAQDAAFAVPHRAIVAERPRPPVVRTRPVAWTGACSDQVRDRLRAG
ncbi:hypothetical protein GCM10025868_21450 [Angustibacter aerolatus]|uniref:Uncharacterized protein n=1 Tax=Angustibacter aerolatus TaxID=1162965 RepID=A0ABQ6JFE2_9ACTN|nr:hypothetical protein [Angustibacter aerolatus]GMA86895.1 hypothetical protein GCM10025868_21450 [Angustibacter aerolatus]